ncbi:MAG: hypothetical protein LUF34_00010 [Lachnospiraceae bacterium]|nr:hypothetical protein [Lachnospiraceae bacterium]
MTERLTEEKTKVPDQVLMKNLHLYDDDGYLTRAAVYRLTSNTYYHLVIDDKSENSSTFKDKFN